MNRLEGQDVKMFINEKRAVRKMLCKTMGISAKKFNKLRKEVKRDHNGI